jgi:DUF971 family protein
MNTCPTDLQIVEDDALLIESSDGQQWCCSFRGLCDACPSAICREKRTGEQLPPTLLRVLLAAGLAATD